MLFSGSLSERFLAIRTSHREKKTHNALFHSYPQGSERAEQRSLALKRKCLLKLEGEWSCRKYDLNGCILKRTGRATTTKPYRNKTAHHGLVLKIRRLKQNPGYDANTFRRTKQEDCRNFDTSPNYNNCEASQGLCGKLSSKTKNEQADSNKTDSQFAPLEF